MPRPSNTIRRKARDELTAALEPFDIFTLASIDVGRAMNDAAKVAKLISAARAYLEATTDPRARRDIDPPRYQVRARRFIEDGLDGAPDRVEVAYDVIDTEDRDDVIATYDTLEAADARAYGEQLATARHG